MKHRVNAIVLGLALTACSANGQVQPLSHLVEQAPAKITKVAPGVFLVDFGRVAFGNLLLTPGSGSLSRADSLTVRFGEALKDGRIDTKPEGSVRFAEVQVKPKGEASMLVAPPPDARNTTAPAVLTPKQWGVLLPYRWVEIEGTDELTPDQVHRRAAFDISWSDDAAAFRSSDAMLDRVWDLCHYSIKATTFAGVFVDGDRERLSYEADAYLNQISYYAGDADPRMPRATFDRLISFPTWPTEWAPHMVFMAYADWMHTGDKQWLRAHYEVLKTKLLNERVGPDGLVMSSPQLIRRGDIVDWPVQERDGYVFTSVNTVVNAFHLRALADMAELAQALGKDDEAKVFAEQKTVAQASFQQKLFDPAQGLYRDGVGTDHASMHANLFPLAFSLVPAPQRQHVAVWLAGRGMAVSVYAAQYLLQALFENGQATAALNLITAKGDRSWRHMVDAGTTITWEAWDQKYKPNQDWNHAWGAAPANLLPTYVLGVAPLTPGWSTTLIQPHPGNLVSASGRVPTPQGELSVDWTSSKTFHMRITLPPGVQAKIKLPALAGATEVDSAGKRLEAHREGEWWVLDKDITKSITLEER